VTAAPTGSPGAPGRVVVSGATGLVGSALVAALERSGASVFRLVRRRPVSEAEVSWNPAQGTLDPRSLSGADAVVHLAGENVAGGRWTPARKDAIRRSRVDGTRLLAEALAGLDRKPRVLVSASAIGIYGSRADEPLTETSAPGTGFLADVCREWEAATTPAREAGVRVVTPRLGLVLARQGGALPKMLTPFRLGLGGVVGGGHQWVSWIGLADLVAVLTHLLTRNDIAGPVNAVAPAPVTNGELTKTLGRVLRRPTLCPLPAFAVRLLFGEMGEAALLGSARVLPARLQASGFRFATPELDGALRAALA
jgi:uncharacterized protein (TIGR01777 family)